MVLELRLDRGVPAFLLPHGNQRVPVKIGPRGSGIDCPCFRSAVRSLRLLDKLSHQKFFFCGFFQARGLPGECLRDTPNIPTTLSSLFVPLLIMTVKYH